MDTNDTPPIAGHDHVKGRYHVVRPFGHSEEENGVGKRKVKKFAYYIVVGSDRNRLRAITGHDDYDEVMEAAVKITRVNAKLGLDVLIRVIKKQLINWSC